MSCVSFCAVCCEGATGPSFSPQQLKCTLLELEFAAAAGTKLALQMILTKRFRF